MSLGPGSESERAHGSVLMRHGNWLLAAVGVALIAMAGVFRGSATVAPIFAFLGVACVVLGVVLERAEGSLELSPTRLRVALQQLASRPEIRGASGEEVVESLAAVLQRPMLLRPPRLPKELAERVASDVAATRSLETAAVDRASEWLTQSGYQIEPLDRQGFPYDLVATRTGETLYIEVKAGSKPLGEHAVRRAVEVTRFIPSVVSGQVRFGIWAATPGVSQDALKSANEAGFIVFMEWPAGHVERHG